jgi:hypothetical protein
MIRVVEHETMPREDLEALQLKRLQAVEVPDRPGGLGLVLQILAKAGVNVEYLYAFVQHSGKNAVIIFRFDNLEQAIELLQKEGIHIYKGEEVYRL